MPRKTLRTDLPEDVWHRLADEATARGTTIAGLARDLIVARDARKYDTVKDASPSIPDSNETGAS